MLLRESSNVLNQAIDFEAVVDPDCSVEDFGFPAGAELLRFATAANRCANPASAQSFDSGDLSAELHAARHRVLELLGREALVEAAATVAAFNGLVRVADGTGIELDDGLNRASVDMRSDLKLNDLSGAANTQRLQVESAGDLVTSAAGDRTTVETLFVDADRR